MHNICVKMEHLDEQLDLTWRASPLYQRVIIDGIRKLTNDTKARLLRFEECQRALLRAHLYQRVVIMDTASSRAYLLAYLF